MTNRDPLGYLESLYVSRLNTKRGQLMARMVDLDGLTDVISVHARNVIDARLGQLALDLGAFADAMESARAHGEQPQPEGKPDGSAV
jgi:hypothetical protein